MVVLTSSAFRGETYKVQPNISNENWCLSRVDKTTCNVSFYCHSNMRLSLTINVMSNKQLELRGLDLM